MLNPIFAQTNGFAEYADSAHKLLSCNRDFYIAQSRLTVNGRVPTADEVRASFNPRRQSEAAAARGALADGVSSTEAARPLGEKSAKATARRQGSIAPDASTHSPLTDEQPRRAALPIPGTYDPDPPTPDEVAEAFGFRYGESSC